MARTNTPAHYRPHIAQGALDGWRHLASQIIVQAVEDYRHPEVKTFQGRTQIRKECDMFFKSSWFELLAEGVGVHPDTIRKQVLG